MLKVDQWSDQIQPRIGHSAAVNSTARAVTDQTTKDKDLVIEQT